MPAGDVHLTLGSLSRHRPLRLPNAAFSDFSDSEADRHHAVFLEHLPNINRLKSLDVTPLHVGLAPTPAPPPSPESAIRQPETDSPLGG